MTEGCAGCTRDRAVTLELSGERVCTYCERHRHECEARAVLAMRDRDTRRLYVFGGTDPLTGKRRRGVQDIRGVDAARRLETTILALWRRRKTAA